MTTVFLPWRGEFGQMLMTFVRWVHGAPDDHKVVCCRRGDEPLFPSATEFFYEWVSAPDATKNTDFLMGAENHGYLHGLKGLLQARYPEATIRFPLDGVKPQRFPYAPKHNFLPVAPGEAPEETPDILVAPRYREHGAHRNYRHWHDVIDGLETAGFTVGLLGVPEASMDRPGLPRGLRAWDHPDNLAVTLHWMRKAKLVLCTDSGIAHLAVLARAPLSVIYGRAGVEAGKESWRWAFDHMKAHAMAPCEALVGGWEDYDLVVSAIRRTTPRPNYPRCWSRTSRYAATHGNSAASPNAVLTD